MTKVSDPKLSREGEKNFHWARAHMGALTAPADKYSKTRPLEGVRLHKEHESLEPKVYGVSAEVEEETARAALKSMGVTIGTQTDEQVDCAKSWKL